MAALPVAGALESLGQLGSVAINCRGRSSSSFNLGKGRMIGPLCQTAQGNRKVAMAVCTVH